MQLFFTALLLLPGALSLPASGPTNTTDATPCVSHIPQTNVDADLTITVWNEINCKGSRSSSYRLVYEQNLNWNTFFSSYTLSRK